MSRNLYAAVAAMALLSACSRTHTVNTKDGSVSLTEGKNGSGAMHVESKDGTTVDINTGKSITDYPSDVPLYSGKPVMDVKSGEHNARMVLIQTSDALDKINGFYKSELDSKGWKVNTTMNTEKMVMYTATKEHHNLVVQISGDGSQQSISQTLEDKP